MPNSIIPTQIGSLPYSPTNQNQSRIVLGKDNTAGVTFEAVGIGGQGRPDSLEAVKINFSKYNTGSENYKPLGSAILNVEDIYTLFTGNVNVPQDIEIKFRQVSVCEVSGDVATEKFMIILGSQPFVSGTSNTNRSF